MLPSVMLASASDALIVGFNVRPNGEARQLADREGVESRTYSVIYRAVEDRRDAMQGLLAPEEVERARQLPARDLEVLQRLGIHLIQGYMLARPMSAQALVASGVLWNGKGPGQVDARARLLFSEGIAR